MLARMPHGTSILPEFDHEMANTRRVLERIPNGKFGWKPHARSWPMGGLASHVANLPTWVGLTLGAAELDIAPPGEKPRKARELTTDRELLETFDANVRDARAAIETASDEEFAKPWTLKAGGRPIFTMEKRAVLRSAVMNHLIHHRAQLCVYLRLNDLPVPALYGPSADETTF